MDDIKFIAGFAHKNSLSRFNLPQIAIVGKSNVGKSTLLNILCNRKKLARVSKTPGCTRQINFFSMQNKFVIADLPGYGFAKVSKQIQDDWEKLILHYIESNKNLLHIILLIDARRGVKENDLHIIKIILSYEKRFDLVFTKTDKVLQQDMLKLENQVTELQSCYLCSPKCFFINNKEKYSVQKLRNYIFNSIQNSCI